MSREIANNTAPHEQPDVQLLLANIATTLLPTLTDIVSEAVENAMAASSCATMSKDNFCRVNGISPSLLEKWIANGVVLLAPTPTTTVKRTVKCKETGKERTDVMEKHGNALVNIAAWNERNRQHARKCRYIKP